jgi:copper transport protein
VFTVGEGASASDDLLEQVLASDSNRAADVAAGIFRFLQYVAGLLAAGGVLFLVAVHDRKGQERRVLDRIIVRAAIVGAVAALAGIVLQSVLTTGLGIPAALAPAAIGDVATSTFGLSALVLLVGLAVIVAVLRGAWTRVGAIVALTSAVLVAGSYLITGHTATSTPRWLVLSADLAHTAAGAAWFGGLVLLWVTLRRRRADDDPVGAASIVSRFSSVATLSVVAVALAGLALAWVEVRAARALFTTAYGIALLIKVAVVAGVFAIAAYNRSRLVPAVRKAGTAAWARLRYTVQAEVAGLVVALLVTAVLVNLVPARDAAGITAPLSVRTQMGSEHLLDVTVDPNRVGPNEMHFYLFNEAGRPAQVESFLVELTMPSQGIGPIEREPAIAGPGHWVLPATDIPIAGRWDMTVTAALSRFDETTADVALDVGP